MAKQYGKGFHAGEDSMFWKYTGVIVLIAIVVGAYLYIQHKNQKNQPQLT